MRQLELSLCPGLRLAVLHLLLAPCGTDGSSSCSVACGPLPQLRALAALSLELHSKADAVLDPCLLGDPEALVGLKELRVVSQRGGGPSCVQLGGEWCASANAAARPPGLPCSLVCGTGANRGVAQWCLLPGGPITVPPSLGSLACGLTQLRLCAYGLGLMLGRQVRLAPGCLPASLQVGPWGHGEFEAGLGG